MSLPIAIVMGTTLVLCVAGWKLGDVFRDWIAMRRLDVESRLEDLRMTSDVALATANDAMVSAEKTASKLGMASDHRHEPYEKRLKLVEDELERLRIRTMRS